MSRFVPPIVLISVVGTVGAYLWLTIPTPDHPKRTADPAPSIPLDVVSPGDASDTEDSLMPVAVGQQWQALDLELLNQRSDEIFAGNAGLATVNLAFGKFEKIFVFPDGEAITFRFNASPPPESLRRKADLSLLDDKTSGGFYERLAPDAAQGNSAAAIDLFQSLVNCRAGPKSDAELQQALIGVRDGFVPAGTSIESVVSHLESHAIRCSGVSRDMEAQAIDFLRIAADSGDLAAALAYAQAISDFDPLAAEPYFRTAWDAGIIGGLSGLAQIYSGRTPSSYEDVVDAAAFALADAAIRIALYDGQAGEVRRRSRARVISDIDKIEAMTSFGVYQDVVSRAREVLATSDLCCRLRGD